jgi:hypothetical protein
LVIYGVVIYTILLKILLKKGRVKMEIIKKVCDICESVTKNEKEEIQVIFTTEQTEGKSCEPYLEIVKMNVCISCKKDILKGKAVTGWGAMGYNNYRIKNENLKK